MHFGPEWMRTKSQPLSSQLQPSPPSPNTLQPQASTLATYSALVSVTPVVSEKLDESHPFRYSKEELLAIYREGGGKGGLGLEVDRWEGVVREVALEPVTLREMTDAEKKLFAGSLNSEMRRRPSQSTDYFSPLNTSALERPRMMSGGSVTGSSPLRERFGAMKRKDATDPTASMPRKPSLSTLQVPGVLFPTSPRTRVGYTSNFDGILNNGESWIARRRFSEASMRASNSSGIEIQAEDTAFKPGGIAESSTTAVHVSKEEGTVVPPASASMNSVVSTSHSEINAAKGGIDTAENFTGTGSLRKEIEQSPAIHDLAAIEWSYKDPTGQVQGPFRADLMQKWYEGGYFTPDLPMRRTHLDRQWSTVQELVTQASGASVFLTPPLPGGPPGLNQPFRTPEYNEPFQPAPIRSLRTSTVESSLGGTSLSSDSPSSSLDASQLKNSSPESSTLIGSDKRPYGIIETDKRIPEFGLSASSHVDTRLNHNEFVHDLNTTYEAQTSESFVPDSDVGLDGHVFNNHSPSVQDSWTGFPNPSLNITNASLTSCGVPPSFFDDSAARGYGFDLGVSNHLADFSSPQSGTITSNPVNYAPTRELGIIPFTGLVTQPYAQIPDFSRNQPPSRSSGLRIHESINPHVPNGPSGHPPWNILPGPGMHPSIAEPTFLHANNSNGVAVRALSQTSVEDLNADIRHDVSQGLGQLLDDQLAIPEQDARASVTVFEASSPSEVGNLSSKTLKPKPPSEHVALSDNSVAQGSAKSAWSKDHDKGKKGAPTSISLRAIQEAEAKRQQNLKATEREKERTRGTTSAAKEDLQSFTTSWGLPTSQAGARGNMQLPVKDVPTLSVGTIQTSPVWTTTTKAPAVKKSMKEIQEEEERRKTQAKDNFVTSKRVYAETTSKTTPSPILAVSSNTSPWATVGPNGKTTFLGQSSRAPVQTTSFSSAVSISPSTVSRSTWPVNQSIATASPTRTRSVTTKFSDVPEAPSHEFLKWLGESLKGLNNTANVEEVMSMLFSFPLDPDSSTMEIISDTIYTNSTTLDGRRFAADFVAKRKADVATQSKGPVESGKASANKPVSIADVVKAVPKSPQTEWGFKVVNKKKKSGRL